MKLPNNPFLQAVRAYEKQIGLWISLSSPFAAVAPSGYDWAMIDMEHSPNDYFSVMGQLQVFAASKTTAIIRPEWNNPVIVKRLLDLGAPGLLFPMINTVEDARKAVASTRYPPKGNRGVSVLTRATKFGRIKDYALRVENETAVFLQIESKQGLSNALEISSVDGVDGIFFGPGDIAADLGKIGHVSHADVWAKIDPIAKQLIDKGMPLGTLTGDPERAIALLNAGYTFVACGVDAGLLAKSADALLAKVKDNLL